MEVCGFLDGHKLELYSFLPPLHRLGKIERMLHPLAASNYSYKRTSQWSLPERPSMGSVQIQEKVQVFLL